MNVDVISKNLKKYRKDKKLSMRELASMSDISAATICSIEKAERIQYSAKTLNSISKALGITCNDLIYEKGSNNNVYDFLEEIRLIINNNDISIGGQLLTPKEKNKIIESCIDIDYSIKARRLKM